jgi:hypothetical protein
MTLNEKELDDFFASLKDYDSNLLVFKEMENEIKKRQGSFSETD